MEHDNPIKHSANSKKDRPDLDNALLMPAIEWVAEQIPGGFFIYRADDSMEMLYVNSAVLRIFDCRNLEEFKTLTVHLPGAGRSIRKTGTLGMT